MMITTLAAIRAHDPCKASWGKLLAALGKIQADEEPLPFTRILDVLGLDDALWCLRAAPQYERQTRLFAVWCARQVAHLMCDPHSRAALDVAERYARGAASEDELNRATTEAAAAVMAAAWAAAEAWVEAAKVSAAAARVEAAAAVAAEAWTKAWAQAAETAAAAAAAEAAQAPAWAADATAAEAAWAAAAAGTAADTEAARAEMHARQVTRFREMCEETPMRCR
ncbi:MAG: hypothetical protein ACYDBH_01170 [Acidobacteriaceae bacterium]